MIAFLVENPKSDTLIKASALASVVGLWGLFPQRSPKAERNGRQSPGGLFGFLLLDRDPTQAIPCLAPVPCKPWCMACHIVVSAILSPISATLWTQIWPSYPIAIFILFLHFTPPFQLPFLQLECIPQALLFTLAFQRWDFHTVLKDHINFVGRKSSTRSWKGIPSALTPYQWFQIQHR